MSNDDSRQPTPDEEIFFYNFGYNSYFFQLIEDMVNDVLVGIEINDLLDDQDVVTEEQVLQLYAQRKKDTYGQNVRKLLEQINKLDQLGAAYPPTYFQRLEDSIEIRNYLAHKIAFETLGDMFDDDRQKTHTQRQLAIRGICIFLYQSSAAISSQMSEALGLGPKAIGIDAIKDVQSKAEYRKRIIERAAQLRRKKK